MADDAPWIEPVAVPDDISSLQPDVEAYHRERRQAARRRWMSRLSGLSLWREWGFPAGVVTGALALSTVVFVVLIVTGGGHRHEVVPAPVASAPTAPDGAVHGRLPDVQLLDESGHAEPARALRPALVALLPSRCGCASLVDELAGQADEVGVPLVVVAPSSQDAEVAALPGQSHRGRVVAAFDPNGALASTYSATGVTVLVLSPDATVNYVVRGVQPGVHLEGQLMAGIIAGGTSDGTANAYAGGGHS